MSWDAAAVRALRQHLGLTQVQLAEELGTRQQTISEWETGAYRPRGASATLLAIVAERAGFGYEAATAEETSSPQPQPKTPSEPLPLPTDRASPAKGA